MRFSSIDKLLRSNFIKQLKEKGKTILSKGSKVRIKDIRFKKNNDKSTGERTNKNWFRRLAIQPRLFGSTLILILLALSVVGSTSYFTAKDTINKKFTQANENYLDTLRQGVENKLGEIYKITDIVFLNSQFRSLMSNNTLVTGLERMEYQKVANDLLGGLINGRTDIYGLNVFGESGAVVSQGNAIDTTLAYKNQPWYQEAQKERGKIKFYPSQIPTESKIKDFSIPVVRLLVHSNTNQEIGVTRILLKTKIVSDLYRDNQDSLLFIIDKEGNIIHHPDSTLLGTKLENAYIKNILNQTESMFMKSFKERKPITKTFEQNIGKELEVTQFMQNYFKSDNLGKKMVVSYSTLANHADWIIVSLTPLDFLVGDVNNILYIIMAVAAVIFILALIVSYFISKSISHPVNTLMHVMGKVAIGDLTGKIEDPNEDELGKLTKSFNIMLKNVKDLISEVNEGSNTVLRTADLIHKTTEYATAVSEQVSRTIQSVAIGASESARESENGVMSMSSLAEKIVQVNHATESVTKVAEESKELSEFGTVSINLLNFKSKQTAEISYKITEDIEELNKSAKNIESIVKVIEEIADQTNLLAMNATIEAARAGEAGRGFGVVASEVKKLADKSKEAAAEIQSILITIQQQSSHTSKTAKEANAIVRSELEAVKETSTSLSNITEAMEKITTQVSEVKKSVAEILGEKEMALNAIENISSVSEETAAAMQEVSASSEEQAVNMIELAKKAEELNEVAKKMNQIMSNFSL